MEYHRNLNIGYIFDNWIFTMIHKISNWRVDLLELYGRIIKYTIDGVIIDRSYEYLNLLNIF